MSNFQKRKYLRDLCPCRTDSSSDIDGWQEVFSRARFGSISERKAAAHTIGTLLDKANHVDKYRVLLRDFQCELDAVMQDPKSASAVLGTMKKHGHARKGAARRGYRRAYKATQLQSESEMASWINARFSLRGRNALNQNTTCVKRMVKWLRHRVAFQPNREVPESSLLNQLRRFNPSLWDRI